MKTKERSVPENSHPREEEDEVVVIPPVKEDSRSDIGSEKSCRPVTAEKSESVKYVKKIL